MSAPRVEIAPSSSALEPTCRDTAAHALTIVRDGVITGEGPTTKGRVHFSRSLDADDAAWCARILTAAAIEHQPVSRAEAEALFEIAQAAAERSDDGRFDDLLAKAIAHHAAAMSGLKVPPRTVALAPDTAIESWAPDHAKRVDTATLEWIAAQMRGKRNTNRMLMAMVAAAVDTGTVRAPRLVVGAPDDTAATHRLPATVVTDLHQMMAQVVASGTAAGQGLPAGTFGKTGTAEYGTGTPLKTDAWLIGFKGNIAFAALVVDSGGDGGPTCGPIAAKFLHAAGS